MKERREERIASESEGKSQLHKGEREREKRRRTNAKIRKDGCSGE